MLSEDRRWALGQHFVTGRSDRAPWKGEDLMIRVGSYPQTVNDSSRCAFALFLKNVGLLAHILLVLLAQSSIHERSLIMVYSRADRKPIDSRSLVSSLLNFVSKLGNRFRIVSTVIVTYARALSRSVSLSHVSEVSLDWTLSALNNRIFMPSVIPVCIKDRSVRSFIIALKLCLIPSFINLKSIWDVHHAWSHCRSLLNWWKTFIFPLVSLNCSSSIRILVNVPTIPSLSCGRRHIVLPLVLNKIVFVLPMVTHIGRCSEFVLLHLTFGLFVEVSRAASLHSDWRKSVLVLFLDSLKFIDPLILLNNHVYIGAIQPLPRFLYHIVSQLYLVF